MAFAPSREGNTLPVFRDRQIQEDKAPWVPGNVSDRLKRCGANCGIGGKESTCQCRRFRFDPWVEKIPWRRKWKPTPVFLPGKSNGQRRLVGYSPWGCQESDTTERGNNNLVARTASRDEARSEHSLGDQLGLFTLLKLG